MEQKRGKKSKRPDKRPCRLNVPERATFNRAKRIIRNHGQTPPKKRGPAVALAGRLDPKARLIVQGRMAVTP